MSDEIERITVTSDTILVHGQKGRNICQCAHAKAFHSICGTGACYHRNSTLALDCACMTYVDSDECAPKPKRPHRGINLFYAGVVVGIFALELLQIILRVFK